MFHTSYEMDISFLQELLYSIKNLLEGDLAYL
jgi:hypothetical protein